MSDSAKPTVEIAVEDLLQLFAIAEAGERVSTFFNNDDQIPAWELTSWGVDAIRERCFPGVHALDDHAFDAHPSVGGVQDFAEKITAGILQSMLDDERELIGMAGLFDMNLTKQGEWPAPLHQIRRAIRERIKDLSAPSKADPMSVDA